MPDLPESVREAIRRAQTADGQEPSATPLPHPNIGALLEDRAEKQESTPFLIYYGEDVPRREWNYSEFAEEVAKTANALASWGVKPGDRIVLVSENHADTVRHYFAAWLLGATAVPVNVAEDDQRIAFILRNSGARIALVRDSHVDRILALAAPVPELRTIVEVGKRRHPHLPLESAEVQKQPSRFVPASPPTLDTEALLVYTSGTTGNPKGVILSQGNLLADALAIAEWHRIAEDQRLMCVLPLHHVNGIVVTLMTPMVAGAGVVLNQRFHAAKFFERISVEHVSIVSVVPTILQFLLHANIPTDGLKLGHVRHLICGAGPLTVDLVQKFEHKYAIPVVHGYGLSETTCYSCFLPIDLSHAEHRIWLSRHGFPSIGVPLPVNEMAIHDLEGNELDEGVKGEIVIRGGNVMQGYDREPEANAAAFAHGWFRSGDEGFFRYDELGRRFFFITGRLKEIIIRGGVNISPFEIDEVLVQMPGLEAGIAVGFENEWYGEEIGAYVKRRPGLTVTEDEVLAFCRKHLPFFKSPKAVVFGDSIPVTSTGKHQRSKCRDLFAQWKETQFSEG
jgi:long-chain acyl-CoA synthetase